MILPVAAQPFADAVAGAAEVTGGGLDAVVEGVDHQVVA
jgi:hypothetical protein